MTDDPMISFTCVCETIHQTNNEEETERWQIKGKGEVIEILYEGDTERAIAVEAGPSVTQSAQPACVSTVTSVTSVLNLWGKDVSE